MTTAVPSRKALTTVQSNTDGELTRNKISIKEMPKCDSDLDKLSEKENEVGILESELQRNMLQAIDIASEAPEDYWRRRAHMQQGELEEVLEENEMLHTQVSRLKQRCESLREQKELLRTLADKTIHFATIVQELLGTGCVEPDLEQQVEAVMVISQELEQSVDTGPDSSLGMPQDLEKSVDTGPDSSLGMSQELQKSVDTGPDSSMRISQELQKSVDTGRGSVPPRSPKYYKTPVEGSELYATPSKCVIADLEESGYEGTPALASDT